MTRSFTMVVRLLLLAAVLLPPPLLGAWLTGQPLDRYLEIPPLTRYVPPAPFSRAAFVGFTLLTLALLGPLLWGAIARGGRAPNPPAARRPFPGWGWAGLALTAVAWILAWSRFPWFAPLQSHTFTPLWLGFILVVNASTWQRTGRSLMTHRTGFFLALFPSSSVFWWYFEYLNRFLHNWVYLGVEGFTSGEYAAFFTLAFSTVLPAVLSAVEWLQTFPRLGLSFTGLRALPARGSPRLGVAVLLATAVAGAGFSLWPEYLFPLLWVAPVGAVLGVQWLWEEPTVLAPLRRGDWRPLALPALAALGCGFFWELWNFHSLAHWEYSIPFVDQFHLFEMPVLGYAGYLPFGLACLAAASLLPGGRWEFPPAPRPGQRRRVRSASFDHKGHGKRPETVGWRL
jgi:hypothetical protein